MKLQKKGKIKWLSCYEAYGGGGMTRYEKTRMSQVSLWLGGGGVTRSFPRGGFVIDRIK